MFGLLPSFGREPHAYRPDGFLGAKPMNGIGPITRTVEDAALTLDGMAGGHQRDPFSLDDHDGSFVDAADPFLGWLLTWPLNMTGHPVASVPAGRTDRGLPVGMQVVGRKRADDTVLAASAAVERERPWHDAYPDLL